MKLTWLGHACFMIESNGYRIVVDPYEDGEVPGYSPLRAEAEEILCTHGHGDHSAAHLITLIPAESSPFTVKKIAGVHDHHQGAHRGENTMYVFEAEGLRVAHLGDIGCLLSKEQLDQLGKLDAVMIPVGGFFTVDPQEAAEVVKQLGVKTVIPMHYRGKNFGYDKIGPVEPFLSQFSKVTRLADNTVILEKPCAEGVIVPMYKG